LAAQSLAKRVLSDQPFQLSDNIGVLAELEPSVDPLLDGGLPKLVETPELGRERRLVHEICERGATPESQCSFELHTPLASWQRPRLFDEGLEASEIDRFGIGAQHITPWLRHKHVRTKVLPQP
jgi:hypothetical protein